MKVHLKQEYDREDFDLVSVIDETPLWSAPFGLKLLERVRLKPGIKALDIGCGLGFPLLEIAQRLGDSSTVYGIDPWKRAIERIELKVKKYGLTNVKVFNGVGEKMPFKNLYFDLIVSNNGINNVESIELTLAECFRVSKPGAQFAITLNLEDTMIEFYEVFKEVLIENELNDEVKKLKNHIYSKRKPLTETRASLENAGFRIKHIWKDQFSLRFLDGRVLFNHFLIRLAFIDEWKRVLKPSDLERIFNQVEDKLNKISRKEGVLNLTVPFVTIDCERN
ncbi:class I SAM-dependent methyltransferase [Acidobacteriota bacterium]